VAKFLTSVLLNNLLANPSKKCVYRCIKLGHTHIKSISLLLDLKSSTKLPNGNSLAVYECI